MRSKATKTSSCALSAPVAPRLVPGRIDNIDLGADLTLDPSITAFADGSYVISYRLQNSAADSDIVARIVSPTGTVGAQFDIDNQTDNRGLQELATLSNGNFVAVYRDEHNGDPLDTDIVFQILYFRPARR